MTPEPSGTHEGARPVGATVRRAPPASAATIVLLVPTVSTKAISVPSGDQAGSYSSAGAFVHRGSSPLATSTGQMSSEPSSAGAEEKGMGVPSGGKAGSRSSYGPLVSWRRPVPSGRTTQTW